MQLSQLDAQRELTIASGLSSVPSEVRCGFMIGAAVMPSSRRSARQLVNCRAQTCLPDELRVRKTRILRARLFNPERLGGNLAEVSYYHPESRILLGARLGGSMYEKA